MGNGAGNFIGGLFILTWALPVALGICLSLHIAGKGNRLLWILPMIALSLLSAKLMNFIGITGKQQLDIWVLASEWIIAAILILSAYGFRHIMARRKKKPTVPTV